MSDVAGRLSNVGDGTCGTRSRRGPRRLEGTSSSRSSERGRSPVAPQVRPVHKLCRPECTWNTGAGALGADERHGT